MMPQDIENSMMETETDLTTNENIDSLVDTNVSQEEFFNNEVTQDKNISQEEFFGTKNQNVTSEEFFGKGGVKIYKPEDKDERLNFAQRFGRDIEKRAAVDAEIKATYEAGEIGTAEALLQTIGKTGFGSVLDFLGEVVISAGRGLSTITPDSIERPLIDGATSAGRMFLNTEIGQKGLNAAREGIEAYDEFKKDNPRAARNIEATVNIALLMTPVKGKPKVPGKPTIAGKASKILGKKAAAQTLTKRKSFIAELISPKQTSAVKKEQVKHATEKGIFRVKEIIPSGSEKKMIDEVIKIPGISKTNSLQRNYNSIANEVTKEANSLKQSLLKKDVIFPKKELNAQLDLALKRLGENPLIVGDAQKSAGRVVIKMKKILAEKKSTGSNVLEARKELDLWIKSQKGANIFDPKQENALSIAVREIRTTVNDFLETKAKSSGVKESLKKQSTLLRAMDNIAPKAAEEANNIFMRAWQNAQRLLPLRGEFNQSMAVLFGVGGLGASAMFAPFFTKIVVGTAASYALGKAIMGPKVKKGLSLLLKGIDEAIVRTRDKKLISQMRLDRAAIVELLEISVEKLDEVNQEGNPPETD